jgi:hypothetical protein
LNEDGLECRVKTEEVWVRAALAPYRDRAVIEKLVRRLIEAAFRNGVDLRQRRN